MIVTAARSSESAPEPEVRTAAGVLRGSRRRGWRSSAASRTPSRRSVRSGSPHRGRCAAGRGCGRRSLRPAASGPACSGWRGLAREAAGGDWLSVNVWSPDPAPGAGLPVLVWIPGGGYVIGMSSLPEFDGGRLAAGGAVVVTLNYRLGVEAFGQSTAPPPTGACSTRSPRCSGYATTSGPSAATRTG